MVPIRSDAYGSIDEDDASLGVPHRESPGGSLYHHVPPAVASLCHEAVEVDLLPIDSGSASTGHHRAEVAFLACTLSRRLAILAGPIVLAMMFAASGHVAAQTEPDTAVAPEAPPSPAATEPRPELARPTIWGEPTQVSVGLYVIDVDEVDSALQSFSASVYLEARWNIPALRHEGPAPLHRPWTEVWTPRLAVVNGQQAWRAFPETVEILPNGEVIYRQKIWGHFSQPLDLRDFPEDRQTLTVHVVAAGLSEAAVKMVALERRDGKHSGIAETFSLPDFDVISWSVAPRPYIVGESGPGTAGFEMAITVQRRLTYYMIKVIIPLCLIVMISWVPRWLDPGEVGANLGMGATAFLTLSAYLFAVNALLPPVSYVTRLDGFILLTMLLVFTGLLHSVWNAFLVGRGEIDRAQRLNRWGRALYPAALGAVLTIAFGL